MNSMKCMQMGPGWLISIMCQKQGLESTIQEPWTYCKESNGGPPRWWKDWRPRTRGNGTTGTQSKHQEALLHWCRLLTEAVESHPWIFRSCLDLVLRTLLWVSCLEQSWTQWTQRPLPISATLCTDDSVRQRGPAVSQHIPLWEQHPPTPGMCHAECLISTHRDRLR